MWAQLGLNQRPPDYESGATNQLSYGPGKFNSYFNRGAGSRYFSKLLSLCLAIVRLCQTLISTSTPLGSSSFIRASTVLGVEL